MATLKGALILSGAVVGMIALSNFYSTSAPVIPVTPLTAAEQKQETELQRKNSDDLKTAVGGVIMLKNSMKNPASFELVNLYLVRGDSFCYRYRGTNSFNAVTTEIFSISPKVSGTDEKTWKKNCVFSDSDSFTDLTGRVKIIMGLPR